MEIVVDFPLQTWDAEFPQAVSSGQVKFELIDFFKENPVDGCAFYYTRHIM